jgi:amidase
MMDKSRHDPSIEVGAGEFSDASSIAEGPVTAAVDSDLMPASEWDYRTIGQLRDSLRRKKISALELLEHTIARIETLDQRLNAVVVRDFGRARQAAAAADIALGRSDQRRLLGIPMTIKEAFNVAGLPTTWGFPQFKDFVPKEDAVVVSRVRREGAILLGKTNVPVGLGDFQSYNEIYGTTNNPWDISRSPGGSSGGSAAALAAGFGPLSFGSDIGGSLRMPAHFCGVYAHKPTLGLVPFRGYGPPRSQPLPHGSDIAVLGPMARSAADLGLALDVIAGPDEEGAGIGYRLSLPPPRHANLSDFRVLVIDTHPLVPTGSAVRGAIVRLSERLTKASVKVACASPLLPDLADCARLYMKLLGASKSGGMPADSYAEAERWATALTADETSPQSERTRGAVMSHRDWLAVDLARARLGERWRLLFREWDVVLFPPAAVPAFPHDHSVPLESRHIQIDREAYPFVDACFIWADPATTCGLPSTVAPIDRSPEGLPVGVQIVGPYLEDRTTIAFAGLLEREFGGFVPPPGYGAD